MNKNSSSFIRLAAFFAIFTMTMQAFADTAFHPVQIIGALDWEERDGVAEVVEGPWQK